MIKDHRRLALLFCLIGIAFPVRAQEIQRDDASLFWRQALSGAILGAPSVQAESVTVTVEGGTLVSYSQRGNFLWSYNAQGRLSPYVSRSPEGTSYICRTNGILIAVNRAGRELWRIDLHAPLSAPVLIGWDGRLFISTGKILRCYTASGHSLWRRTLEQAPVIPPVMNRQGGIILVFGSGEIMEINAFGGHWQRKPQDKPAPNPPPVLALPLENDRILLLYENGGAEITRRDGERTPLPALGGSPMGGASRGNRAAIALRGGKVLLLSLAADEGRILWNGESHLSGSTQGEAVYLIYDERGIYALSRSGATSFTEDGRQPWLMRLRGAVALPAFGDDGILYTGGGDWILYAYRLEEQARSGKRSLYGPAPEGSYGTADPRPSSWADNPFRFEERELNAQMAQIGKAVRGGWVGMDELDFTACLMEVVTGVVSNPDTEAPPRPVDIRHRIEAARLLGVMGSWETIPFLVNLYLKDPEALVKAMAAEAIGLIGVDRDRAALRAFNALLFPPSPPQDEQVLIATAAATGALCRFSGPPLSETGIRLLIALGAEDRPRAVRRIALREIASLRQ